MLRSSPRLVALLLAISLALAGCGVPTGPLGMPVMGGGPGTPFNDKNGPDPHPFSESNDAQRAAYEAHQREQQVQQQMRSPDLSTMQCTGSSSGSSGPNAGMMTASTSCHN
jgi:hypothetical protein